MKTNLIRPALVFAVLATLFHPQVAAQEHPVERELRHIQLEVRLENYKQTAKELVEMRKHLALLPDPTREAELVRRLEQLERWQDRLSDEIRELAEAVRREPRERPSGEDQDRADRSMPQGHYLLELNFEPRGGERIRGNFEITGNQIRCVDSSDKRFIGMAGNLDPKEDGRVVVRMKNDHHAATQIWERADDGRWRVLEIPDRGENQMAVPVKDGRIE
jgi:hypothetical protein